MRNYLVLVGGIFLTLSLNSCNKNDDLLKWRYKMEGVCISPPAIGSDGTIYVACSNGGIYAINPDGTIKWEDRLYFTEFFDLLVGEDGTVYAGSKEGCLWAIVYDKTYTEADSLTPVKHPYYDIKGELSASPAIDRNGTIYLVDHYKLYALDTLPHSLKWQSGIARLESSPAIGADGTVYLGATDGKLHAINPDGTPKWEFATDAVIYASPVIDEDGTIYIGSFDDYFYAVNPDGSLKWKFETDGSIFSPAAIGEDGTIYFGSEDKHMYALSKDGKLKWRYKTNIWDFTSPVVGADGVIYIGPSSRWPFWKPLLKHMPRLQYVYAINPDGSLKWKYKVKSHISDPTLAPDGTLYFTCSKRLYALQTTSPGLASSSWPKFGADNQNTSSAR